MITPGVTYEDSRAPIYLQLVKDCTLVLDKAMELQQDDKQHRHLLKRLHQVNLYLQYKFLQRDGIIMKSVNLISNAVVSYAKLLLKGGEPKITELHQE